MNVLYIGPYYDNSDNGHLARLIIKKLLKNNTVVLRPFYTNNNLIKTDKFEQYETQLDKFDIIIQDCPAYRLDYHGGCKNIAIANCPTRFNFPSTSISRLNMMDLVWTVNQEERNRLYYSGVNQVDLIKLDSEPIPNDEPISITNPSNAYVFGWFGDSQIDNLEAFLIAFHSEFEFAENVSLLINTTPNYANKVLEISKSIKEKLRVRSMYKNEIITTIDHENIHKIYHGIDCLVDTSRGKRYSKVFEDFGTLKKARIYPIPEDEFSEVVTNSNYIPCIYIENTMGDLFTGRESWLDFNVDMLKLDMRYVFNNMAAK